MRVDLPERVTLACPHCAAQVAVNTKALAGRGDLCCPFCSEAFSLYDALPVQLRRRVYHALRDVLESKVYRAYRRLHQDSTDPWAAEPGTSGSETKQ